ncbi:MAG: ATP-binding protein, partial [Pseudomonadota bacterium]
TIDTHGAIETFNRAARNMFGYTLDEVRGKNVHILMPEPYHSEHDQYINRYLDTRETRIIGTGREVSAQHKNGKIFPIHLVVSEEVKNPSGRRFVGLIQDISLQRQAEQEAREQREQLAHVDRLSMLGEMAAGIAHEVNQPLTAISLFAQAGKRLLDTGEQKKLPEIFDKLSQHAQRAGAVIERVQDMARRKESSKKVVTCETLIQEVKRLAEVEARIRNIDIEVEISIQLLTVDVDAVQIQQVVLNLLRNGMEAMQSVECAHGRIIKLQVSLCGDGDIEIAVIDSGCGVSEDVAETLFMPFSTSKRSGMGMGLSICRAIVSAHGGQLSFHNNDTNGATFYFTLPAA